MSSPIASLIKARRTVHQFRQDEKPPADLIEEAIEHSIWAPNHHLTQPWHFYLPGPETIEQICLLNASLVKDKKGEKAAGLKLKRWREMPGWLILTINKNPDELREQEDYASACCVAQNLALFLWEQNVGMKWTTGAVTRTPAIFDLLGIDSAQERIVGLFWYGFPEDIPAAVRKPHQSLIKTLP